MALHLVTGYKGTPHITADDVGAFNAGILGVGDYVLASGNKLAASLVSSNTVRILDGDVVIQGRHISLKKGTYEEITINNGTAGMNRNDLIVARYTKDISTGTENAVFAVIQGTETSGTATDPEHTTGDILSGSCTLHEMPLYRIPLTGVTVGEPEALFQKGVALNGINGLLCRGANPFSSVDNDNGTFWRNMGSGVWNITSKILYNQPYTSGQLLNIVNDDGRITQILISASASSAGGIYFRAMQSTAEYWDKSSTGTWRKVFDDKHPPFERGVYWGIGKSGASYPTTIDFLIEPQYLIVKRGTDVMTALRTERPNGWLVTSGGDTFKNVFTWGEKSVSWHTEDEADNASYHQMNGEGVEYHYIAFGW